VFVCVACFASYHTLCVSSCRVLCGVVLVVCLCVWPVSLLTTPFVYRRVVYCVAMFLSCVCVCDLFLLFVCQELNRKLRHADHTNNELRLELAQLTATGHTAYSLGAAAAAAAAVTESDQLAARLHELMRDFTTKTMALSRSDGDLLRKVLRLQSWFLEAVERRVVAGRERFATVHEAAAPSGQRADAGYRPEQQLASASPLGEGRHSSYEPSYSYRPPPPPGPGSAWTAAGADLDSCSDYSDDAH